MKLATARTDRPDGALMVVARDLKTMASAKGVVPTLQHALETWSEVSSGLQDLSDRLNAGTCGTATAFDAHALVAPLPRAWQWLDGSTFKSHADLTTKAFDLPNSWHSAPLMYQGLSHAFLSSTDEVPFPSEADGIDFEGEFGVITDTVPAGVSLDAARDHIRLIVQINDWSLRAIGREEMARGFGWVRAKPACSMAAVAVTPDELGEAWTQSRVHLALHVWRGDTLFGSPSGAEMAFGFDALIAHAAYSRPLCAGTVIGSGTVSNAAYREVGSSCIVERRGIEIIDEGAPRTGFLAFGERVRMEARSLKGTSPFGSIDNRVVPRPGTPHRSAVPRGRPLGAAVEVGANSADL